MIERFHDPDRVITLFSLGFTIDERLEERLVELEQARVRRAEALPELDAMFRVGWSRPRFEAWIHERRGVAREHESALAGRRMRGIAPPHFEARAWALVGGLDPLVDNYPLPHFVLEGARQ